jgi:hypothetical protein
VLLHEPDSFGHRLVRGHVQRDHHHVHASGSQLVGSRLSPAFVTRAEKDGPTLLAEPPGRFETKSLVASGDQHRGLF